MSVVEQLSDTHVRALAREIINRPEFSSWREIDLPFLAAFRNFLEGLSEMFGSLWVRSPLLFWILIWGLALAGALLIAHMVWTIRVALRANGGDAGVEKGAVGTDFVAVADELAQAGCFPTRHTACSWLVSNSCCASG
jgi:hypothetical protein